MKQESKDIIDGLLSSLINELIDSINRYAGFDTENTEKNRQYLKKAITARLEFSGKSEPYYQDWLK